MEDLVKCSVCLRKFEDPRVLPCQHTFCLKPCLEKLFDINFRHIKCPLCRVIHFVTKGYVSGLPKNFTIQTIMDMPVAAATTNDKKCELCHANTDVIKNCECCSKNICKKCYDLHVQKTKENLLKLSDSLKQSLSAEKDSFVKLIKNLSQIESERNILLLSISKLFNEINSHLQQKKMELIQSVNQTYEPLFTTLKGLVETKEIDVAVISSSIQSAADSIAKENISQGHLFSLLISIQNTVPTPTSTDSITTGNIQTGKLLYDIDSIRNSISNFGELKWSSGIVSTAKSSSLETRKSPEKRNKPTKSESPKYINLESNNDGNVRMEREKTFTLNRPSKSIAYEIPVSVDSVTETSATPMTLHSIYMTKSLPILTFGSKGTGTGEFIWPRGIAIDHETNKIIVADSSNHRIQIFSDNGHCEKMISELSCDQQMEGDLSATFDCLSGIAVGKSNRIVCSDRYNHRAIVLDTDGKLVLELGKGDNDNAKLSYPWGIAIDDNENMLVCDKDNHRIQVFSKTGEYIKEIGSYGRQPGLFDNPHYLAVCPKTKNIFVSDTSNHRIQVFDKRGTYLMSFGGDGPTKFHLKYPRGITVDNDGNVLICDYGNNRISIFSNQGKSLYIFGSHGSNNGQFKGLEGIAVFRDGRIVVSDRDNHRIQIF